MSSEQVYSLALGEREIFCRKIKVNPGRKSLRKEKGGWRPGQEWFQKEPNYLRKKGTYWVQRRRSQRAILSSMKSRQGLHLRAPYNTQF